MCNLLVTKQIKIPAHIKVSYTKNQLSLSTSVTTLRVVINENIILTNDSNYIYLTLNQNIKKSKRYLGLYYSLIKRNLKGLTQKFKINLFLKGIGFKVTKINNILFFKLGYSHEIELSIPSQITVSIFNNTNLILYSSNWEQLTQFASIIKKLKKVEPYKGKGILLKNEQILRKEGKKNKK